jgi:hypothetical protein
MKLGGKTRENKLIKSSRVHHFSAWTNFKKVIYGFTG